MEKIIGNKPTSDQKLMVTLHKKLLQQAQAMILATDEKVHKAIAVDVSQLNNQKITGVLVLSTNTVSFVSSNDQWMYDYENINNVSLKTINKEKDKKQVHDQKLTIKFGIFNSATFTFNKNEDTQEFIEILELKKNNPSQEILTTVTHNFDYFLHADRLKELRDRNAKTTFLLMKRDDMGFLKNGRRLLQERHKGASLIVEGYFNEKKKVNDFIVVDKNVFVYEYDNTERKVKLLNKWPLLFFADAELDHFAIKSEVITSEGKLILNGSGKKFEEILVNAKVPFVKKKRKVHQKAVGFRSGKRWKKAVASISYALVLLSVLVMVFGEDTPEPEPVKEISTVVSAEIEDKSEATTVTAEQQKEEEAKLAEAEKLAAEQKAEEEQIAAEKKAAEEKAAAEKLAAEQKAAEEKAEAERVALEKAAEEKAAQERAAQEEAARVAAEQQQSANVFYENCSAVRAAGADPIRTGDPGYSRKLDRDGDGIACE